MAQGDLGTLKVGFAADIKNFLEGLAKVREQLQSVSKLQQDLAKKGTGATIRIEGLKGVENAVKSLSKSIKLFSDTLGLSGKTTKEITAILGKFSAALNKTASATTQVTKATQAASATASTAFSAFPKNLAAANTQTKNLQRTFGSLQQQIWSLGGASGGFFSRYIAGVKTILAFQLRWYASYQLIFGAISLLKGTLTTFLEFRDVMAQVRAIANTTAGETERLAQAARKIGRTTIVSATDAAKALQLLAQTGFTAGESIDAINAVTALAIGGVSTMDASVQLLTTSLRAFQMDASKADEVANILVATVNQSKSSIEGLNTAFNYSANAAAASGLKFQDLAAITGVLADNGIQASTQGTALRQVIAELVDPAKRARDVFERLGINIRDLNPLTNDIVDVFKRLRSAGFGAQEAFQAFERRTGAAVVTMVRNAEAIEDMRNRIVGTDDATRAFEQRQESLQAQLGKLANQFKDIAIEIGEELQPYLMLLVKGLQEAAEAAALLQKAFADLALPITLAASVVALTRFFGTLTKIVSVTALLTVGLETLGKSLLGLITKIGPLAGLTLFFWGLTEAYDHVFGASERFRKSLEDQYDQAKRLEDGVLKLVSKLHDGLETMQAAKSGTSEYSVALSDVESTIATLMVTFPALSTELRKFAQEAKTGAEGVEELSKSMTEMLVRASLQQQLTELQKQREAVKTHLAEIHKQLAEAPFKGGKGDIVMGVMFETSQARRDLEVLDEAIAKIKQELSGIGQVLRPELEELEKRLKEVKDQIEALGPIASEPALEKFAFFVADLAAKTLNLSGALEDGREKSVAFAEAFIQTWRKGGAKVSFDDLTDAIELVGLEVEDLSPKQQILLKSMIANLDEASAYGAKLEDQFDKISSAIASAGAKAEKALGKMNEKLEEAAARYRAVRDAAQAGLTFEQQERAGDIAVDEAKRAAAKVKAEKELKAFIDKLGYASEEALRKAALSEEQAVSKKGRRSLLELSNYYSEVYYKQLDAADADYRSKVYAREQEQAARTRQQVQATGHEILLAKAQQQAEELRLQGKRQEAIRLEYAAKKQLIELTVSDPTLQRLELEKLALEEKTALLKEGEKERKKEIKDEKELERLRKDEIRDQKELHEIRLRQLELDNKYQQNLLDIAEEKLAQGRLNIGVAQAEEQIARRRLELEIQLHQQKISESEQYIASLQEEAKLNTETGEDARNQIKTHEQDIQVSQQEIPILQEKLKLVRKAGTEIVNLGQMFADAIAQAFEGIILGTSKLKDVFKNLGNALLSSITQALAKSLVAKLGFDRNFQLNILNLGGFIKQILGGSIVEGMDAAVAGADDRGIGKKLFDSVFGLLKNLGGGLVNMITGVQGTALGVGANAGFTATTAGMFTTGLTTPMGAYIGTAGAYIPTTAATAAGAGTAGAGAAGAQLTAQSIKILGMTAGQLVAVVGSLISLGITLKDAAEWMGDATKQASAGQAGPRGAMQAFGGVTLGVGIGGGAAAGASVGAAGGPIGAVVGGLAGAAVGAAIAQAINQAITQGISGAVSESVKKGLTQAELEKKVNKDIGIRATKDVFSLGMAEADSALGPFGGALGGAAIGLMVGGPVGAAIGLVLGAAMGSFSEILGMMIPDIETIYEKAFTNLWKNIGQDWNRQLKTFLGQGLGPEGKKRVTEWFKVDDELRGRAKDTTLLITGLMGAGVENYDRMGRFFKIMANNLAKFGEDAEHAEEIINRMIRYLTGGSIMRGMRIIQQTFAWMGDERVGRQFQNMIEAYKGLKFFEGFNLEEFVAVQRRTGALGGRTLKLGAKPSREAAKKAVEGFITADTYEEGLEAFYNSLRDSAKNALLAGFQQALVTQGGIGMIMTEFFGKTTLIFKKMMKSGVTDVLLERLTTQTDFAMENLSKTFDVLEGWLPKVWELIQKMLDGIDEHLKTALDKYQDTISKANLRIQVETGLADAIFKVTNLFRTIADTRTRLGQKIYEAGGGEGVMPGAGAIYLQTAQAQQATFLTAIKGIFDPEIQLKALGQLEDTVDQFLSAAVKEIEETFGPAIEQARKALEVNESLVDTLLDLRSSFLGGRPVEDRLDMIRAAIDEQEQILLDGKPDEQLEAAKKLQDLNQKLLDLGREEFDESSPMFRALFDEVVQNLTQVEDITGQMGDQLETLEAQQAKALKDVRDQAKTFYTFMQNESMPLIKQDLDKAATDLDAILKFTAEKLGFEGTFPNLFTTLAGDLGDWLTGNKPTSLLSGVDLSLGALPNNLSDILGGPGGPLAGATGFLQGISTSLKTASQDTLDLILAAITGQPVTGTTPPPQGQVPQEYGPAMEFAGATEGMRRRTQEGFKAGWNWRTQQGGFGTTQMEVNKYGLASFVGNVIKAVFSGKGQDEIEEGAIQEFITNAKETVLNWVRRFYGGDWLNYTQVAGFLQELKWWFDDTAPAFKKTTDKWDDVRDSILAGLGGISHRALAEGAIVAQPLRALIGEAGPEAVIPLNQESLRRFSQALIEQMNRVSMLAQGVPGRMVTQMGSTSSQTSITLNVAQGAFTATLYGADPVVVGALPERMMDQLERSIRHGKLGAIIERRVGR